MDEPVIRLAATVLLLRDGADGLEVFMVRRHHLMGFAGDALVFPGGRLDQADTDIGRRPELCCPIPGVDTMMMAFRVGALRETFEEAGVLIARREGGMIDGVRVGSFAQDRAAIAANATLFTEFLTRERLTLAADFLVPFARWITPPVYPKRYDTMFFLAAAPGDQIAAHDGLESVDSLWITAAAALDAGERGAARVEFATRRNLEKLGRSRTVEEALAAAWRGPVVTVLPLIQDTAGGRIARLPPEAGYGETFDFGR